MEEASVRANKEKISAGIGGDFLLLTVFQNHRGQLLSSFAALLKYRFPYVSFWLHPALPPPAQAQAHTQAQAQPLLPPLPCE